MENKVEQIVKWLTEKVNEANVDGLIVGLSGGLDSAVVAHLIEKACPNKALAVIMPIKSNPNDINDAKEVVKTSGIRSLTIDLSKEHEAMINNIISTTNETESWYEDKTKLADANLRARLRMSTLYTVATNYNYLVVGTDNAAEWYTGYFTKYGDGGVDIQPIIDLTKEEVFEMARYLGVPSSIIEKKPSADLWVGQTDEEELGVSYKSIDAYLKGEEINKADKEIIDKLHKQTEHKRNIAPHLYLK